MTQDKRSSAKNEIAGNAGIAEASRRRNRESRQATMQINSVSGLNASYVTKNSAPREAYLRLLSKSDLKKEVNKKYVPTFANWLRKNYE